MEIIMLLQIEVNFVEFSVDHVICVLQSVYGITEPIEQLQMVQWLQLELEVACTNGLLSKYYDSAGVYELNMILIELAYRLSTDNSPAAHITEAIKAVKHDFARQTL
jgi:hypothetical protein